MLTNLRNRILVLLGCLMLLFGIFPVVADAAEAYGGVCGDNLQWHFSTSGKLTIIGSGAMYDYVDDDVPWLHFVGQITSLELPEGLTTIGCRAFAFTAISDVRVPDSVTSIGNGAFSNCYGLTSVIIPNSVTSIGDVAFRDCTGLTSVIIGNGVTRIGDRTFSNCTGLSSVFIGNSVTTIGGYAFYDCTSLTSVTISDSITSVGVDAFYNCPVEKLIIADGAKTIVSA